MFPVMIICRVSWSLLVRKTSSMLFFLVGSSIYCCKHCSCANCKRKYRCQQIIKPKKNVLNQIKEIENLKISINTEKNLRETRAIAAIKNNPKYFYKFVKNNSKIRAGIGPLKDEEEKFEPSNKNKRTTE